MADTFAQQIQRLQASKDPNQQLQGALGGGAAVQVAGTGLTVDELMGQLGLNQAQVNQTEAYQQLQGSYAQANAGIGQEQNLLSQQGLGAQAGLLGTQYGIQQQTLAGQEQLAGIQHGLSEQQLADQKAQQALSYQNQVQNTQGSLAASGALNTEGSKQVQNTNAAENQFAQAALQRSGTGLQAQYGYQQQQFGLEAQGQAAQQGYSLGSIARGQQGLELASQANGLSLDQTLNQINYGMQQAGLAGQGNADQLYGQIGSAVGQGATYQAGAIGYGALLGGVNLNQALAGQ